MKVTQSSMTLCDPMDYSLPGSPVHGILQARILDGLPFLSVGDLPNPGTEPRSPALWADSLPAEPQGKPKNTGVVSLSLLQGIFPTQESNHGLLHCRRILYQLSYQGVPTYVYIYAYSCTHTQFNIACSPRTPCYLLDHSLTISSCPNW